MTLKPKGGRGYKAPYETHQVRVPDPLIPQVHQLIERYQEYLTDGGEAQNPPQLLDYKPVDSLKALEELSLEYEQLKAVNKFTGEAVSVLQAALKLKANAGGAIKKEIEKALTLLSPSL